MNKYLIALLASVSVISALPARADSGCPSVFAESIRQNNSDRAQLVRRLNEAKMRLERAKAAVKAHDDDSSRLELFYAQDEIQGLKESLKQVAIAGHAHRSLAEAYRAITPACRAGSSSEESGAQAPKQASTSSQAQSQAQPQAPAPAPISSAR